MSDLKNEQYQVEYSSDTNAAEPLETKFACKPLQSTETLLPAHTLQRWDDGRLRECFGRLCYSA